jgi:MoaA/NifB/PqqE/SkfB family radical SAM enzyme
MHFKYPERVYLEITTQCLEKCQHCYLNTTNHAEELNTKLIKNLIDQIKSMGVKKFIITGGDPLVRTDLFDILLYCRQKKIKTLLLTAGTLVDRDITQKLAATGVEIKLSIDGIRPETHNQIRGQRAFEKLIQSLQYLKQANIQNISLHFTLNSINFRELTLIPEFMQQMELHNIEISTIKPAGRALINKELLIDPALIPLIKADYELIKTNPHLLINTTEDINRKLTGCPAAMAKMGIDATGYITPCVFLGPDYKGLNIKDHTLIYLWNNDPSLQAIRDNSSLQHNDTKTAGCPARALYFNKSITAADPYCKELKKVQSTFARLTSATDLPFN